MNIYKFKPLIIVTVIFASLFALNFNFNKAAASPTDKHKYKVVKTDAEWKKLLPKESYEVLRHAGTEEAFTGKLWDNHLDGTYVCAGCGQLLFSSKTKFESNTGWPSFWKPAKKENVIELSDKTLGMERTEVLCARCGGHLGHLFDDGPKPTGLHYCMNSAAMKFVKAPAAKK